MSVGIVSVRSVSVALGGERLVEVEGVVSSDRLSTLEEEVDVVLLSVIEATILFDAAGSDKLVKAL